MSLLHRCAFLFLCVDYEGEYFITNGFQFVIPPHYFTLLSTFSICMLFISFFLLLFNHFYFVCLLFNFCFLLIICESITELKWLWKKHSRIRALNHDRHACGHVTAIYADMLQLFVQICYSYLCRYVTAIYADMLQLFMQTCYSYFTHHMTVNHQIISPLAP